MKEQNTSEETEFKITMPDGTVESIRINWKMLRSEMAFRTLREVCFWNKFDFNECLAFIESNEVSWIDISNTLIAEMSIAEACNIVKARNKEAKV